MGRPSKLTPDQWAEVDAALLLGEEPDRVARRFAVTEYAVVERARSIKAAAIGNASLARLWAAVTSARDDEEMVTRTLRLWLFAGRMESVFRLSPIVGTVFEFNVGPARADLLTHHSDGGVTLFEAKADGSLRNIVGGIGQLCVYSALTPRVLGRAPPYITKWLVAPASDRVAEVADLACAEAGVLFMQMPSFAVFRDAIAKARGG